MIQPKTIETDNAIKAEFATGKSITDIANTLQLNYWRVYRALHRPAYAASRKKHGIKKHSKRIHSVKFLFCPISSSIHYCAEIEQFKGPGKDDWNMTSFESESFACFQQAQENFQTFQANLNQTED